ncbi:MAG TPA: class II fructose-bisphosphatase [Roseiflexaceae bacterium]|nr:class II fructose-bisphosphatase [Roseiflexaceae bacterium]
MTTTSPRNLGLDLVRATEAAALAAGRWMGLGKRDEADDAAGAAMLRALNTLDMDGRLVVGEEAREAEAPLRSGQRVGTGDGPPMDVVADPIDGRNLLATGRSGAIAVAAVAPRGSMWPPTPAVYMEKIVVDREVAPVLVEECMGAPAAWTLALVARAKGKAVRDLVVFVLERPRHHDLVAEIRAAGARVMLKADGDIAGALMAATHTAQVDLLMGIGGVPEGLIAACAIKSLGGAMLGRLAPQSAAERAAVTAAGLDTRRVMTCDTLVSGNQIFFTATGITDGPLLTGVRYTADRAESESIILRCETGTRRRIHAEHLLSEAGE